MMDNPFIKTQISSLKSVIESETRDAQIYVTKIEEHRIKLQQSNTRIADAKEALALLEAITG